jgi:hypothetical protein
MVRHQVTTLDAQPSSQESASLIVSVTGQLMVRRALLVIVLVLIPQMPLVG